MTYAKAYAAAIVVVVLYIINGITTGEWAVTENLESALSLILVPIVVWAVPNQPTGPSTSKDEVRE